MFYVKIILRQRAAQWRVTALLFAKIEKYIKIFGDIQREIWYNFRR